MIMMWPILKQIQAVNKNVFNPRIHVEFSQNYKSLKQLNDSDKDIHTARETNNPIAKILWIILGSLFVIIGGIGAVVPGLPTTLFLILAAACYIRSSQKLYDWLITNKTFGPYLKDYREGRGMPRNAKILAVSMIVLFTGFAVFFAIESLVIRILVGLFGAIGFYYVAFKVPVTEDIDKN